MPLYLLKDRDLHAAIRVMLGCRRPDSAKKSKVKADADQSTVAGGSVRRDDLVGNNNGADIAADLGRLRQNDGGFQCTWSSPSSKTTLEPHLVSGYFAFRPSLLRSTVRVQLG